MKLDSVDEQPKSSRSLHFCPHVGALWRTFLRPAHVIVLSQTKYGVNNPRSEIDFLAHAGTFDPASHAEGFSHPSSHHRPITLRHRASTFSPTRSAKPCLMSRLSARPHTFARATSCSCFRHTARSVSACVDPTTTIGRLDNVPEARSTSKQDSCTDLDASQIFGLLLELRQTSVPGLS